MSAEEIMCPTCGRGLPPTARVCPEDGTVLEVDALEPSVVRDMLIGTRLGEYQVEQRIGSGGMGIVYRGRQPVISKTVAIKVLRPDMSSNPVEVERILTEARTVNAIGHRGIIDIFGFGELPDGRQYLVMEYLEGAPLDRVIAERAPMPYYEVLPILDELLDALAAVHSAGVIHRDLKPSNIFLATQRSGAAYVKILDFGLAKQSLAPGGEARQTRQSMVCGTPEFMAPEQARALPVSPRTDLYALGCIAYEMLTGQLPFVAASAVELMMAHIDKAVTPPSHLEQSIPEPLDHILLRLLAKSPEDRPANAAIVRTELKRFRRDIAEDGSAFRVPSPLESFRQPRPHQAPTAPQSPPAELPAPGLEDTYVVPSLSGAQKLATPEGPAQRPPRRRTGLMAGLAGVTLLVIGAGAAVVRARPEPPAPAPAPLAKPADPEPQRAIAQPVIEIPPPPPPAPEEKRDPEPAPVAAVTPAPEVKPAEVVQPKRKLPGELLIHIRGWAMVIIDGEERGHVPPNNRFTLPAGYHQLELRQQDRTVLRKRINVRPGKTVVERVEVK